jgi:hypothetical protein
MSRQWKPCLLQWMPLLQMCLLPPRRPLLTWRLLPLPRPRRLLLRSRPPPMPLLNPQLQRNDDVIMT